MAHRHPSFTSLTAVSHATNELNQYDFTATAAPPCSTQPVDVFDHDEDGNLIEVPNGDAEIAPGDQVTYVWDAENRLIRVLPKAEAPTNGARRVEYTYDYMNRRVERIVTDWDPELGENGDWETTPVEHTRYVYHGWNVILELDALDSNAVLKKYTWGLDLAGQNGGQGNVAQSPSAVSVAQSPSAVTDPLQGAGGIGGLLACLDTAGTPSTGDDRTFVYSYDANGNVTQLVETTSGGNYGTLAAAYEYDAYGNTVVARFGYADDNLIRFSTRPVDPVTNEGLWLARILDFERGRWSSRDPSADVPTAIDHMHLYRLVLNDPIESIDALATKTIRVSGIDPESFWRLKPTDYITACGLGGDASVPCGSQAGLGALVLFAPLSQALLDADAQNQSSCVSNEIRPCAACPCVTRQKITVVMIAPKTTHTPSIDCACCRVHFLVLYDHQDVVPNGTANPIGPGNGPWGNQFWNDNFRSGPCTSGTVLDVDFEDVASHGISVAHGTQPRVREHGTALCYNICATIAAWTKGEDHVVVCHSQGCNIALQGVNKACHNAK